MNYNAIFAAELESGVTDYRKDFNVPFIPKKISVTHVTSTSTLDGNDAQIFAVYMSPYIDEPIAEILVDGSSHTVEFHDVMLNVTGNFSNSTNIRILDPFNDANPTISEGSSAKIILHFKFTA